MSKFVWIICKKNGKAEAYYSHENDAEGYINAFRNRGFEDFEITKTLYKVDNSGRKEAA